MCIGDAAFCPIIFTTWYYYYNIGSSLFGLEWYVGLVYAISLFMCEIRGLWDLIRSHSVVACDNQINSNRINNNGNF